MFTGLARQLDQTLVQDFFGRICRDCQDYGIHQSGKGLLSLRIPAPIAQRLPLGPLRPARRMA